MSDETWGFLTEKAVVEQYEQLSEEWKDKVRLRVLARARDRLEYRDKLLTQTTLTQAEREWLISYEGRESEERKKDLHESVKTIFSIWRQRAVALAPAPTKLLAVPEPKPDDSISEHEFAQRYRELSTPELEETWEERGFLKESEAVGLKIAFLERVDSEFTPRVAALSIEELREVWGHAGSPPGERLAARRLLRSHLGYEPEAGDEQLSLDA